MRKQTKRFLAGLLAAACTFSSISVNGLNVTAAEGNSPDTPWQAERYELENGRTFVGEGYTKEITIKSGGQFSGGKAIDTMDKNGNGAGVEIAPNIEGDSLYSVVLGYSKGIAYKEGKIALYKNDERVDYFEIFTSDNKVVTAEPIVVRLDEGDKLSLISDTGVGTDAVACFDYLDVSLWGGRYEAENGEMTSEEMTVRELEIASRKKMAAGFEKADGTGVKFPFVIPQDGTYTVKLGYNRVNYETADQIGLYVNGERAVEIELIGRGNTDEIISWSDDLDIDLKAGDTVAVKRSAAEEDLGLLELDYLEIAPKTVRPIDPETLPKFTSSALRVVKGDSITVPVKMFRKV